MFFFPVYWNRYFLWAFLFKSLLSVFLLKSVPYLYFSLKIYTFTPFSKLRPLLSLSFLIETSTLSLLFYWSLYFPHTFLMNSFSIGIFTFSVLFYWNPCFLCTFFFEIFTVSLLFYWNLYFLFTFLLKPPLSLIACFSLLFYWNVYFRFTFLLKPLLSLHSSIEMSTCSLLSYWNLLFALLLYWNLYFLYFPNEASTFSLLFKWNLYCLSLPSTSRLILHFSRDLYWHGRLRHIYTSIALRKITMPCFPKCN